MINVFRLNKKKLKKVKMFVLLINQRFFRRFVLLFKSEVGNDAGSERRTFLIVIKKNVADQALSKKRLAKNTSLRYEHEMLVYIQSKNNATFILYLGLSRFFSLGRDF